MHLLLDNNIAQGLFSLLCSLPRHQVVHARDLGWAAVGNGELIALAEAAGFDVLVTADQRIRYQQNLGARQIGLVVLPTPMWPVLRRHLVEIVAVIDQAGRQCFLEVDLPRPPLKRRPPPSRA